MEPSICSNPYLSRNLLISSSLMGVGLIVLAIHMLRTASETPKSAAIRGILWSEFSTKRVRSPKSLCSSDSSKRRCFLLVERTQSDFYVSWPPALDRCHAHNEHPFLFLG